MEEIFSLGKGCAFWMLFGRRHEIQFYVICYILYIITMFCRQVSVRKQQNIQPGYHRIDEWGDWVYIFKRGHANSFPRCVIMLLCYILKFKIEYYFCWTFLVCFFISVDSCDLRSDRCVSEKKHGNRTCYRGNAEWAHTYPHLGNRCHLIAGHTQHLGLRGSRWCTNYLVSDSYLFIYLCIYLFIWVRLLVLVYKITMNYLLSGINTQIFPLSASISLVANFSDFRLRIGRLDQHLDHPPTTVCTYDTK